jgi:hypothetical protein
MPDDAPTLSQHIAAARTRLGHLAGLSARTDAAERAILKAAQARLAAIQADLDKLRGRAVADPALGDRYTALVLERGQVELVIAHARQALAA